MTADAVVPVLDPSAPSRPWATWGPDAGLVAAAGGRRGATGPVIWWTEGTPFAEVVVSAAPEGERFDTLGLPRCPIELPLPVGAPVAVDLHLGCLLAEDAPRPHRYRLRAAAGSARFGPVGPDDPSQGVAVRVDAEPAALRRWLHDRMILGHLLIDGSASADGELVALSLVEGWVWAARAASPLPIEVRAIIEALDGPHRPWPGERS